MRSLIPGFAALAFAASAAAQSPGDFAWAFPLQTPDAAEAYVIELDEAVYARLAGHGLRDLMVFGAEGQAVPFAPLPPVIERAPTQQALPWMRVPATPARGNAGEGFSLRLERDGSGRLRDLQLQATAPDTTVPAPDLLIDLGDEPPPVSALRIVPGNDAAGQINLRVNVLASTDLANWRPLAQGLALVSLHEGGLQVERLRLDFAASRERYLRLSLADGGDWPALQRIERIGERLDDDRPAARELLLEGEAIAGSPGSFRYTLPGPLPVEAWDLRLASANTVAQVELEMRLNADDDYPLARSTGVTVFRLGSGTSEVRQLPVDININRTRHWILRSTPALTQAPSLQLRWRPDRFAMLAQPPAPYTLHVGSRRAERPSYPVAVALRALADERPGWKPPTAVIGAATPAGGEAALRPDRGPEYRRWTLWAVLAIAGLLVLAMALRVLRQPPSDAGGR